MGLQEVRVRPVAPALLEVGHRSRAGSPVRGHGRGDARVCWRMHACSTSTRPRPAAAWPSCSRPCSPTRRARHRHPLVRHRGQRRTSSPSPSASTTTSTARPATAARSVRRSTERYEATLAAERRRVGRPRRAPATSSLLHDPQTAGLAPPLMEAGVARRVAMPRRASTRRTSTPGWAGSSCGATSKTCPRSSSRATSSRRPGCHGTGCFVIPPSIDPFSAKNEAMSPSEVLHVAPARRPPRRRERPGAGHLHAARRLARPDQRDRWTCSAPARHRPPTCPSSCRRRDGTH